MRVTLPLILLALGLGLSACASTGDEVSNYSRDLAELRSDCESKEGVLIPTPGATDGLAALDYYCEIRGSAPSDRIRRD